MVVPAGSTHPLLDRAGTTYRFVYRDLPHGRARLVIRLADGMPQELNLEIGQQTRLEAVDLR